MLALEWPLPMLAGSSIHRSVEARLALIPLVALLAALLYQGANAAVYYVVGLCAYFWAYSEGEVRYSIHCLLLHLDWLLTLTYSIDHLCQAMDSSATKPAWWLPGVDNSYSFSFGLEKSCHGTNKKTKTSSMYNDISSLRILDTLYVWRLSSNPVESTKHFQHVL